MCLLAFKRKRSYSGHRISGQRRTHRQRGGEEIVVAEDADNETLNETLDDGEPVITEPAGETESGANGVCVADMTDWQLFESFHKYADHSIRLLLPQALCPLPVVTGDRDLLGLAFYNLLDNACKFTGPGDVIELRAAEDGPWLVVEVADTGPGIAPEELPHLFEELYRGRNARQVAGSGLGLALAQRIAARHGATITVRSRLVQGTVFTLRLPLPA